MESTNKPRSGRIVSLPDAETKFPELGKIKVGKIMEGKGGKKDYPTTLDYFIATGKYASKFDEVYPDEPKTISVIFPTDNLKDVCNERFECRSSSGRLLGSGDGVIFKIWNEKSKEYVEHNAEDPKSKELIKNTGDWKHILTLRFIIPKINNVFGLWRFETRAKASSIPAIRDTFDNIMRMAGTVVNVPFDLVVDKVKSQKPGDTVLFPVVNLIPSFGPDKIDEIRQYLQAGNNIMDIKKLLEVKQPDMKALEDNKAQINVKQISQNNDQPATLFPLDK